MCWNLREKLLFFLINRYEYKIYSDRNSIWQNTLIRNTSRKLHELCHLYLAFLENTTFQTFWNKISISKTHFIFVCFYLHDRKKERESLLMISYNYLNWNLLNRGQYTRLNWALTVCRRCYQLPVQEGHRSRCHEICR